MSELLTTAQAAEFLSVTESCVRRWVLERRLPHVKLGRLLRFEREALESFVTESRVEVAAPSHTDPTRTLVAPVRASRAVKARTPSDLRKRWLERVREAG